MTETEKRPKPLSDAVNAIMSEFPSDAGLEELLAWKADADSAVKALKDLSSMIDTLGVPLMPPSRENFVVEHVGVFRLARSQNRTTWHHEIAAKDVIERAWTLGEINGPKDASSTFLKAAGVSYWRIGELKRLELRTEDYRDVEYGGHFIRREA